MGCHWDHDDIDTVKDMNPWERFPISAADKLSAHVSGMVGISWHHFMIRFRTTLDFNGQNMYSTNIGKTVREPARLPIIHVHFPQSILGAPNCKGVVLSALG